MRVILCMPSAMLIFFVHVAPCRAMLGEPNYALVYVCFTLSLHRWGYYPETFNFPPRHGWTHVLPRKRRRDPALGTEPPQCPSQGSVPSEEGAIINRIGQRNVSSLQ